MSSKKTLVVGASTNPARYSFLAINALRQHGHEVVAVGLREGMVADVQISKEKIIYPDVDTVTMYVGIKNQQFYYDYVEKIQPKRVIFNLGTENMEFQDRLFKKGIQVEIACTLFLLSTGQY